MKKFIAYFDYLGYKQLVLNNDLEHLSRTNDQNCRDMETALSQQNYVPKGFGGYKPNLTQHKINCTNFSDTIVYWSNDDSIESLEELLKVAFLFNKETTINFFPARGALAFGELEYMDFRTQNEKNAVYSVSSPIGKAMVYAHDKAESTQWSGAVIDSSLIEEIENRGLNVHDMLDPYAIKYNVPYKVNKFQVEEYALRLTRKEDDINPNMLENLKDRIKGNFARHNKDVSHHDVQLKIANTIKFLEDTV